jgi:very-short-patch-repair endonuclease
MSKKYTTKEFIEKGMIIHGNKYNYDRTLYINSFTKVLIDCREHGMFKVRAGDHIFGYGCPKCNKMYITTEKFIKKANLVHNNQYDYSSTKYINAKTKVIINCKIHGEFIQRSGDHLNGAGCPHCNESRGENLILKYLKERKIVFEREKNFKECKGIKRTLPFDFYLPKYNILIEYDGEHHFNVINYWGGKDKLKKQQKTDEIKNLFAVNQNIKLLRIRYNEINNIDEILSKIVN